MACVTTQSEHLQFYEKAEQAQRRIACHYLLYKGHASCRVAVPTIFWLFNTLCHVEFPTVPFALCRRVIYFCIMLSQKSNRDYERLVGSGYLRLMSSRQLRRYKAWSNTGSGFHSQPWLDVKAKCMAACVDPVGVAQVDEVSIQAKLAYDLQSGALLGCVDVGPNTLAAQARAFTEGSPTTPQDAYFLSIEATHIMQVFSSKAVCGYGLCISVFYEPAACFMIIHVSCCVFPMPRLTLASNGRQQRADFFHSGKSSLNCFPPQTQYAFDII